jgi:hypothetical protein
MRRFPLRWSTWVILSALTTAAGLVGLSAAQTTRSPSSTDVKVLDRGAFDPVVRLQREVESLTGDVEALKRQVSALQRQTAELQQQSAGLRGDVNRLRYESDRPGGILGLTTKYVQKGGWDRVPGDALIRYWIRP